MHVVYVIGQSAGGLPHYTAELANEVGNRASVSVMKPAETTADDVFEDHVDVVEPFRPLSVSMPKLYEFDLDPASIVRGISSYAGLQRIPQELYDAARVDGAGRWARFRYVTVPQLKPVVFVTTVLVSIYALNTFDLVYALTGGGPGRATEVLALFMYQEGFAEYHLGRAAAVAVLLLALNLVVTAAYLRAFDVTEEL